MWIDDGDWVKGLHPLFLKAGETYVATFPKGVTMKIGEEASNTGTMQFIATQDNVEYRLLKSSLGDSIYSMDYDVRKLSDVGKS